MDLAINQLFQWCDERARIERILWIGHEGQRLVTIDVADKKAWPSFVDRSYIEHQIASGAIRLLDSDMYGYLRQPDNAFTLSHIKRRDKAWEIIEDIIAAQEESIGEPDDGSIFHSSIPSGHRKNRVFKTMDSHLPALLLARRADEKRASSRL